MLTHDISCKVIGYIFVIRVFKKNICFNPFSSQFLFFNIVFINISVQDNKNYSNSQLNYFNTHHNKFNV